MKRFCCFIVTIASALVGCSDNDLTDPADYHFQIQQSSIVAGSDLRISSELFARVNQPLIMADTMNLAMTRLNDTTVLATVPSTARGVYSISIDGYTIGQIAVAGFVGLTPVATELVGRGYATSFNNQSAWILGTPDRRVVRFSPASGNIQSLLQNYIISVQDVRGAGVTPQQDLVLLSPYRPDLTDPWNQPIELWRLDPLEQLGTLPIVNTRVAALFNDTVFFKATHHTVNIFHLRGGVWELGFFKFYEETFDVVLSPRGDRAAILFNWATSTNGAPVFNTVTGDTVYHVNDLRSTRGAHFSASGDTLYLLGESPTAGGPPSLLLAVSPSTGEEMLRLELDEWIVDSAFDPATGKLYLVSANAYGARMDVPEVYVVDAGSLELLGLMRATVGGVQGCDYPNTIAGPDGVFYLCNEQVWRFDRVP